jgi:glutathione S-transferase
VDNTQNPPFAVMETSAELLYLLKFADKEDKYGFKDELERNQCLQWLFFAHGSMAPYQGKQATLSPHENENNLAKKVSKSPKWNHQGSPTKPRKSLEHLKLTSSPPSHQAK